MNPAKKTPFTKIILIVILMVIAVPAVVVSTPWVLCNTVVSPQYRKVTELTNKLSVLQNEDERIVSTTAERNGDCLTGSGTVAHMTIDAKYQNLEHARKDIAEIIGKLGIPMPDYSNATKINLGNNRIGDSIEIQNAEHQYIGVYDFSYTLQELTESCVNGSAGYFACINGVDTGMLPDESRPISGVDIEMNLDS